MNQSTEITLLMISTADDEMKRNAELENLVDKLRTNAMQLIDMLDGSIPIVAKFKVCFQTLV